MVKSCRVKKRTIKGRKRERFNGFKQTKNDIVNSNVNNALNTLNTQKLTKTVL